MQKRGISQETLKLIACVTMLIDHVGYLFIPGYGPRIIGRLAFPIFCFLLAEGEHYTRNPKKYALRLGVGILLSELPFDFALYGGWTWGHQSVMVTLLLGFLSLRVIRWNGNALLKLAGVGVLAVAAELLHTDYGMEGVLLIVLFGLSREAPNRWLLHLLCMLLVFDRMSSVTLLQISSFGITLKMMGALAVVPISLYSGEKATGSKVVQWAFYLFYPVHLAVLFLIRVL